jgi:protein-S-isoprenylcysteine O-methyltransferase Ste14
VKVPISLAPLGKSGATLHHRAMAAPLAVRLTRTIIILPGTALVFVPAAILWATAGTIWAGALAGPASPEFWIALALLLPGLGLAAWTSRLFITVGEGTPAPWDPPQKLVVRGPYRFVRNPMITSVLIMLAAEALLFRSWPIVGWMAVFWLINAVYFPLSEEKGLEKRFGEDYRRYKANVPRWIPRLTPWNPRHSDQ